jgi:benzoyl-CoA reductase/2-hydroxyglutaryl-CoA dehydratase subunit BcrC/BadD/HgdB
MLETILSEEPDWMNGFVFTAGCDHLRRLYDNVVHTVKPPFCHILGTPYKTHSDAKEWYREELALLTGALAGHFGLSVGDDDLRQAIEACNETRRLLSSLNELRKGSRPPLTGEDMQRIVIASLSLPKASVNALLAERIVEGGKTGLNRDFRARILLVGSQLDDPEYVRVIEDSGALVVADGHCFGSLQYADPVETGSDPLGAIAERYLEKTPCPRMFDAYPERFGRVVEVAREFGVQGIIIQAMKFCDCWGIEANVFVDNLRQEGFQVLRLEREYALGGVGQLRTRIQAFLESMGC